MTQPDPNAQSGVAGAQSGTEGQTQPTGVTPPPADPAAQSGQQPPATVAREEYEAILRRMQASDQNNSKLQEKLKAFEDAQLTEQQKTANALKEAQEALAAKAQELEDAKLENALLADATYTWHNPATVLALVDRKAVEWKDGKPVNTKAVLDQVAKDHPYLVKPAEPAAPAAPAAPTGVVGQPVMNNGRTGSGDGNRSALEDRFPALKGRVPRRG
jgi:hypothetical protein